jgi:hypothetical protein
MDRLPLSLGDQHGGLLDFHGESTEGLPITAG